MKALLPSFVAGLLFSLGLGLAGMTRPTKVLAFLDWSGAWDPALLFVMLGAITTYGIAFRLIQRRRVPLQAAKFVVPTAGSIDRRLLVGAVLFGVGWGLGGFCPGPAVVSATTGMVDVLVFMGTMLLGMGVFAFTEKSRTNGVGT